MLSKMYLLIVLAELLQESLPLRILGVSVPPYPLRGDDVHMECLYELQQDTLYSVKWYREDEEFYRYVPKEVPVQQSYKLEGIRVVLERSDAHRVLLQSVSLRTSGLIRCEVNAEAPSFASVCAEGLMDVVYMPREGPRITRPPPKMNPPGQLILNCTSGKSYPAAELAWYLNNQKVTDPSLLIKYPVTEHAHGLLTTSLGLKVHVDQPTHARCTSTMVPAAQHASREAMLLVKSSSTKINAMFLPILTVFYQILS